MSWEEYKKKQDNKNNKRIVQDDYQSQNSWEEYKYKTKQSEMQKAELQRLEEEKRKQQSQQLKQQASKINSISKNNNQGLNNSKFQALENKESKYETNLPQIKAYTATDLAKDLNISVEDAQKRMIAQNQESEKDVFTKLSNNIRNSAVGNSPGGKFVAGALDTYNALGDGDLLNIVQNVESGITTGFANTISYLENVNKKKNEILDNMGVGGKILAGLTGDFAYVFSDEERREKGYDTINNWATNLKKQENEKVQKNIESTNSKVTKKVAELSPSMGNNLVGAGISAVNPVAGTAYFVTSAAGSYYDDAINRGMNEDQALLYGGVMGAMEGLTEEIPIGKMLGAGKNIGKATIKETLKEYGISMAENAIQEAVIEPISEISAYAIGGKETADFSNMTSRMLKSGVDGALSAVLLSGVNAGVNSAVKLQNKIANKQQITSKELQQCMQEIQESGKVDVEKIFKQEMQYQAQKTKSTYYDYNTGKKLDTDSQNILNQAEDIIKQNNVPNIEKNIASNQDNTQNLQQNIAKNQNNTEQRQTSRQDSKTSLNSNVESQNNYITSAQKYNIDTNNQSVRKIGELASKRGINITYDDTLFKNNSNANAIYQTKTDENGNVTRNIILNPNANTNSTLEQIELHEIVHDMYGTEEFNKIKEMVLEYDKSKAGYQEARAGLEELYSQVYDKNSSDFQNLVDEEAVADILGNKLGDQQFVNELVNMKESRSVARKIYDWIVEKLNNMTRRFENMNSYFYWKDVKNKFEEAFRQEYQGNSNSTRYSVMYNDDGTFNRVKIEDDIFKNNNGKSISQTMMNYLKEHIGDYAEIIESGQKVYLGEDLPGEYSHSKSAENLPTKDKLAKGRAVTGLQEIIENAQNRRWEPNKKKKHSVDAKYGFYRYDTNFSFEHNGKEQIYSATILIRNDANGKKYLYDILNPKKIGSNLLPVASNSSKSSAIVGSSNSLPINSIAQNDEKINSDTTTQYSMQESENNSGSFNLPKTDNHGNMLSKGQQEYFKDSKVVDENGRLKTMYHGTQRADRVGTVFEASKATSGPMAFFTDNQEIANSYSQNKTDTSLSREYNTEYDLFKINGQDLDTYWKDLSNSQKQEITERGENIGFDENFETIVFNKNASKDSFGDQYRWRLNNEYKGNAVKTLYSIFIEDGNLMFEDMSKFKDVLEMATNNNVEYLDTFRTEPKVYEVYLNIKNPFDTSQISAEIVNQLRQSSKTAKIGKQYSADAWDKSNITPEQWISKLQDDIENGTTYAWTIIPDWVTDVLKQNGYDGILDTGGKNGGENHQVAIPFYSEQIKNITNIYPSSDKDIRFSTNSTNAWQEHLDKNYKNNNKGIRLQDVKLPTKEKWKKPTALTNSQTTPDSTSKTTDSLISSTSYNSIPQKEQNVNNAEKETSTYKNNTTNKKMNLAKKDNVNVENDITGEQKLPLNEESKQEKVAKILTEPIEKVKEKDRTWAIFEANVFDKGIVFEKLSKKADKVDGKAGSNRDLQGKWDFMLLSQARGQNAIGEARYEYDSKTKTRTQICKSLEDIKTEVGNNRAEFYDYMYHQLNIDRMTLEDRYGTANKPVFGKSVTAEISQKIVAEYETKNPKFKEWAQDVYDYNNANKQELVKNGVISQETADHFAEMYPHYVPIKRVDKRGNAIKVPLETNRTGINSPIAKAKGGNGDIQSMFETMADRTLQTYRASARNSFGVELKNTLDKLNQLQQNENVDVNVDDIVETMGEQTNSDELLQKGKNGMNPTFTVFENGKKVTFDVSKDMYDALKPLSDSSLLSKTIKPLNKFNNFRRAVLTEYNPVFLITNAIKDVQDVIGNSQHATKTYLKFPEAYYQILSKGYWYNEYVANGGKTNSYFNDGKFESDKKVPKAKNIIKKVVTFPFNAISSANNVIEMAPRLAEYIASRESGASIQTSMLDASRVTTNFKAGGDLTKFANRNGVTFLNASVQGMMQQVRNIQEANAKGIKGWTVLACKYTLLGVPTLILNHLLWGDDDDYEELPDYVKDNYYCIAKFGDGRFIRIPKGRLAATVGKVVSNVDKYITGDKELNADNLVKDFWEDLLFAGDNLAPNNPIDNNVISPVVQAVTNRSWYGEDIVPSRLQDKPVKEQYDETTDSLSIWLGDKLNVSPYKINYVLDQYSGGAGDVVLPMMTKQAENNVIEDKFTTDSTMKSKYPGEFYSKIDELKINSNGSQATDEDILKYKYASSVSEEMGKLYKKKREIQNSDETDEEKKKQLKEVQKQINELAKNGLKDIEDFKIKNNSTVIGNNQYYKTINLTTEEEQWEKLSEKEIEKNKNIKLENYADYKKKVAKETISQRKSGEIEKNKDISDKSKMKILINSKYDNSEKASIYENYIGTQDELYSVVMKNSGININEYLKYKTQEFTSDKKDDGTVDGKSISGSKKKKVYEYVNNMKITGNQRLLLLGTQYKLSNSERTALAQYVKSLKITNKEKLEIYKKLQGFKVYKDGRVTW